MFLSMNWIGDFVDLSGLDKKALIKDFTLSTAEVEDIIEKGSNLSGVVVAKILSVENHPESKKLHLLKVDKGDEIVDIVCGAPNVREGMKVALATVGGRVGDITIAPRTLAGYTSYGMCCSEAELGISDDHSGLIEIFEDVPLGTDIKDVYDIDDIIFEVDNKSLTNRPDLWSHYGMAREFATIAKRPLKAPELLDTKQFEGLPAVMVDVKATDLVYRYSAIKVKNVTRKISPVNMRIRLYYCGSRAINFLADLTNYVMMELGQPMHAFDNAKVDKIEVQTFKNGLKFTTLDGVERNIDENTLKPAPKIFKDDCRINWNDDVERVHNIVRGLSPYPAAWTPLYRDGVEYGSIKIFESHIEKCAMSASAGTIRTDSKSYIAIACADGWLYIDDVQLAGKKRLATKDLLLGWRDVASVRCTNVK